MTAPNTAWAPSMHYQATSDPFSTSPTAPERAARIPSRQREAHIEPFDPYDGRTHISEQRLQHAHGAFPHKSASMSSEGSTSTMTPISSVDLEKTAAKQADREAAVRCQRQATGDPEKAVHSPSRHNHPSRDRALRNSARVAYLEDEDDAVVDSRQVQEKKAFYILLFLAGPCAVLSFLNAIWTLISLFITFMTQPVRLCARRPTFGQQLGGLVGPALNLQLKSIYTPLPPHADEDTTYSTGMLLVVMLLSPILSMGMAFAAWVAAIFWMASAVVGDPAGLDKRDDGRETVLALRNFWEQWLIRSMRED